MSNLDKYFYRGVSLSNIMESGTTDISGTNMKGLIATENHKKITSGGITNVFKYISNDVLVGLTGKKLLPTTSDEKTMTKPVWVNSCKVKLISKNGGPGASPGAGNNATDHTGGAQGNGGAGGNGLTVISNLNNLIDVSSNTTLSIEENDTNNYIKFGSITVYDGAKGNDGNKGNDAQNRHKGGYDAANFGPYCGGGKSQNGAPGNRGNDGSKGADGSTNATNVYNVVTSAASRSGEVYGFTN